MNTVPFVGAIIGTVAVVCVSLVVATVLARISRLRRERSLTRLAAPHRMLLLEVAAGEDDDGSAAAELATLAGPEWNSLRPAVIAMLSKVRGAPAEQLVEVLRAQGEIDQARRRLRSRSAIRRARGAHLLGLTRDHDSVADLVELLNDPAGEVRLVAARSLGMIKDASAAQAVLQAVPGPGDSVGVPAWVAAEALLDMGIAAEKVIQQGLVHEDPRIRGVSVTVAGRSLLPATAQVLRERLLVEPDPMIRADVVAALGYIGTPSDVPTLVRYTAADEPSAIRRTCARALGMLGDPSGADPLAALLGDSDRRLAQLSAQSLVALGTPGFELLLAATAQGESAKAAAATALTVARLQGLPGAEVGT